MYVISSICVYYFSHADDEFDIQNVQIHFFLLEDVSNRPSYLVFN